MTYRISILPRAIQDATRLDKKIAQRIFNKIKWLSENFDNITPEALTGDLRGLFKLRAGSHRRAYSVSQKDKVITIHLIGHRRDIYKAR